ncbi:hypothetical protein EXU48_15580 [Occultella glacieicola]|uniref:Alpha/beta hydrolase n=1 Tax=Occultella glacieicola TaxID=2518684 RepID=A0ABY2E0W2_9MICO|nr:hypothetical protein [Occultella glacieicola]TDE91566.1 hypothetical protein EXU48_15580 [Occultella glacieicola]
MIEMVLLGLVALALIFALLAPLESLRWWSRRKDSAVLDSLARPETDDGVPALAREARLFVVYLSGIGAVDGTTDSRREQAVLATLAQELPDAVVTADVFPYAVDNRGLTQRATNWFWKRLQRLQRVPVAKTASKLINLRNALRVLVSADPRYGPSFNLAIAQEIAESLSRHGYDWDARAPVTVIGYSGGGQIALGASWYLAALDVPVSVFSIGGVLASDPALDRVQHLWHVYGSKDRIQLLGPTVFPGRWPTARVSSWARALREGRITMSCIGPMRHMGRRDYFDRHVTDDDGVAYRQRTVDALLAALRTEMERPARSPG